MPDLRQITNDLGTIAGHVSTLAEGQKQVVEDVGTIATHVSTLASGQDNHERRIGAIETNGGTTAPKQATGTQPQDQQPKFVGDGMIEVPYRLRIKVPSLETEIKLTEASDSGVPVAQPRGWPYGRPSAYQIARPSDFGRPATGLTREELSEELGEMGETIGSRVGQEVGQALTGHTKEVASALAKVKPPVLRTTVEKPAAEPTPSETEQTETATVTKTRNWATWIVTGAVVLTALAVITLVLSRL